jgi:NADH:ubiquinone oxidoreductase subunit B-like Fe-S oxidoreductase
MGNVLIHKASELRPQTRAALEAELGRSLGDDEEISIMAFVPHDTPTGEARTVAVRELQEHFNRIDQKTKTAPEEEREEALNEALRSVRPGYRERE